jgi:serine/threonine protein kinase
MANFEFEENNIQGSGFDITKSHQNDVLDEIYRIEVAEPLSGFDNDFCKYYKAYNLDDDNEYFAIVFERNYNPPIQLLHTLKTFNFNGLNNLITYGVVRLSHIKEFRLVAIVPQYDLSKNLDNYIQKNGPLSADQIEHKFIPTITEILSQCERLNITCGNINPNNIIIQDDNSYLLREFFISYPHFYQSPFLLAPELAECVEVGRATASIAADIYAFGLVALYLFIGKQPWSGYETILQYNNTRFDQSSFKFFVGRRKIPEYLKIFFKWTLHDSSSLRWKVRNLHEWVSGSYNKNTTFDKINDNVNLIAFNNQNYTNVKSLSYALFNNWDEGLKFIQEEKLAKWVQRQQGGAEIIENIQEILGKDYLARAMLKVNTAENNNKLTRLLSALDPGGGVRVSTGALTASSIPNALHYLLTKGRPQLVDSIITILKEKYWQVSEVKTSGSHINFEMAAKLDEVYATYSPASPASGLEMMVYSLNPNAICLSPLLSEEYVYNLADLLKILDKLALNTPDRFNVDRHIIAFIMSRIGLKNDNEFKLLRNFPKFSDHPLIYGLSILNIAASYEPEVKIPNICSSLVNKIIDLFQDHLHNVKFKQQLEKRLKDLADQGDLSKIVDLLSDQNPFIADYNGYYNACREVQNIKNYVQSLGAYDKYSNDSIILGQKITVLLGYILCLIVTVILMV